MLVASYEAECSDLVSTIVLERRAARCRWADFAVLYRLHAHRDLVAAELAERGIPFSIESMDVTDMPQVRDLLACLGAVVSADDDASLFRVAALSQFSIDPEKLRAGMQALPKDSTSGGVALVLAQMEGGAAVLEALEQARAEIRGAGAKAREGLEILLRRFGFARHDRPLMAVLDLLPRGKRKPSPRPEN